jgi:hypothetical protein
MTEYNTLTQLARILCEHWDEILAAGGKQEFEEGYGELTARNMYYWLTRTEDDDDRWEAELLVGLGERLKARVRRHVFLGDRPPSRAPGRQGAGDPSRRVNAFVTPRLRR